MKKSYWFLVGIFFILILVNAVKSEFTILNVIIAIAKIYFFYFIIRWANRKQPDKWLDRTLFRVDDIVCKKKSKNIIDETIENKFKIVEIDASFSEIKIKLDNEEWVDPDQINLWIKPAKFKKGDYVGFYLKRQYQICQVQGSSIIDRDREYVIINSENFKICYGVKEFQLVPETFRVTNHTRIRKIKDLLKW